MPSASSAAPDAGATPVAEPPRLLVASRALNTRPTIPVHRPYVGQEALAAVGRVFESRWLGMGAVTKAFEQRLRELLGVKHVARGGRA